MLIFTYVAHGNLSLSIAGCYSYSCCDPAWPCESGEYHRYHRYCGPLSRKLDTAQLTFLMAHHVKNLFCSENFSPDLCQDNRCVEAHNDRVLVNDIRVLDNLLISEDNVQITDYCRTTQTNIKPHMRKIVTDWMLEVCEDQQCQSEVFFLAVNYLDRFLSRVNIKKTQFQLLASVCMLLASKFYDVAPMKSEQLVIYTDNTVSVLELREWEIFVLSALQWELSAATAHSFIQHFCNKINNDSNVRSQAETIAAQAATDYHFITTKQSVIAAAALAAALKELNSNSSEVLNLLKVVSSYIKTDLKEIFLCIEVIMNQGHVGFHSNISGKQSKVEERPTTPDDLLNISQNEIIV